MSGPVTLATRHSSFRTSISGPRGPRPPSTVPPPNRESTLALGFNHFFHKASSESSLDDPDPTPSTPFPPSDPILHSFNERLSPQIHRADTQFPTDYEEHIPIPCKDMSVEGPRSHQDHLVSPSQSVATPSTARSPRAQRPPSEPVRPSPLPFIPASDDDDALSSPRRPPASAPVGRGFRNVTFIPSRSPSPELGPIPETPLPVVYQARKPSSKTNNPPVAPPPPRGFRRSSPPPLPSPPVQPLKKVLLPEVSLGSSLSEALGLDSNTDMPLRDDISLALGAPASPADMISVVDSPAKKLFLRDEVEINSPALSPSYDKLPDTPYSDHSACSSCRSLRDYASEDGTGGERLLGSDEEDEDDRASTFSNFAPGTPASLHQELPGSVPVKLRQLSEYRSKPRKEEEDTSDDGLGVQEPLSASVVGVQPSPGWHASSSSSSSSGGSSPVEVPPAAGSNNGVQVSQNEEQVISIEAPPVVVEDQSAQAMERDGVEDSPNLTPLTSPYSDDGAASVSALDINAPQDPEPVAIVAQELSSSPVQAEFTVEDVSSPVEQADDASVSEASFSMTSPYSDAGGEGDALAVPVVEVTSAREQERIEAATSRASTPSTHPSTESDSTEDGWTLPAAPAAPPAVATAPEPPTGSVQATSPPVDDYAAPPPGSPTPSPAALPSNPALSSSSTPNPVLASSALRDLSPLDRALLLLDSDYQITDDDILPEYMLYPNRQAGERTVDRGPRRAYQQVRPPPSYDSLPPRPKVKKPKVKKEGSGLRSHLRAVFGRGERERPASMVDVREGGGQHDQEVPPWVGRPASVAGGEAVPSRGGGLLRRIRTNASASSSNVSVVNENEVRRAEAEAAANGNGSASRRGSVAGSTRSGVSANGSVETSGSGNGHGHGHGHGHEHEAIEEGASCPFPAAVPVEGRPFLRDGQILIYPEGASCPICHNTGYADFDPRRPCLICWKKFSRPFTKLLAKFFDSEDVSESDRARLQRPLPEMPQSAPPAVGSGRASRS